MPLQNRETAANFLAQLWQDAPADSVYELRAIGSGATIRGFSPSVQDLLAKADAIEGQNLYYGVAPRLPQKGGRKEAIGCVTALWADLDKDIEPGEAARLCAKYPIKPSCVIRSGHGYHIYWLLEKPVGPKDFRTVERCNRRIAEVIGADAACADVTRILRLPGSLNVKSEPHKVCYAMFDEQARFSRSPFETHALLLPPERQPLPQTPTENRQWRAAEEGERNTACFQLAARLQRVGVPEGVTLAALHAWNWSNAYPLPSGEVASTVHGVYRRGVTDDPTPGEGCWTAGDLLSVHNEPVEWVLDKLVPRRGVTMLSGEGGIGKSFFALDIAMAVATGRPFVKTFETTQGPVIYVDMENDEGTIGRRIAQLALGRGVDGASLPLYVPKRGKPGVELQMDTPEGRAWLWGAICEHNPVLVVLDSLIALHSGDENSNVAMRQLMAGLDGMARDGNLGLVVVHHQRKRGVVNDAGQLMRGASDLRNAIVSHVAARRQHDEIVLFQHDKCRPAKPADPFSARLADKPDGSVVVELVGMGGAKVDAAQERERIVLERLQEGPARTAELATVLGYPERTVRLTLQQLVAKSLVERGTDRMYRLVEAEV